MGQRTPNYKIPGNSKAKPVFTVPVAQPNPYDSFVQGLAPKGYKAALAAAPVQQPVRSTPTSAPVRRSSTSATTTAKMDKAPPPLVVPTTAQGVTQSEVQNLFATVPSQTAVSPSVGTVPNAVVPALYGDAAQRQQAYDAAGLQTANEFNTASNDIAAGLAGGSMYDSSKITGYDRMSNGLAGMWDGTKTVGSGLYEAGAGLGEGLMGTGRDIYNSIGGAQGLANLGTFAQGVTGILGAREEKRINDAKISEVNRLRAKDEKFSKGLATAGLAMA